MDILDESESAHEAVEKRERLTTIQNALKLLPVHQSRIILMYHANSMSYEDIAETLSLPIGTVKSRLNRARLSLRQALQPKRRLFVIPKVIRA